MFLRCKYQRVPPESAASRGRACASCAGLHDFADAAQTRNYLTTGVYHASCCSRQECCKLVCGVPLFPFPVRCPPRMMQKLEADVEDVTPTRTRSPSPGRPTRSPSDVPAASSPLSPTTSLATRRVGIRAGHPQLGQSRPAATTVVSGIGLHLRAVTAAATNLGITTPTHQLTGNVAHIAHPRTNTAPVGGCAEWVMSSGCRISSPADTAADKDVEERPHSPSELFSCTSDPAEDSPICVTARGFSGASQSRQLGLGLTVQTAPPGPDRALKANHQPFISGQQARGNPPEYNSGAHAVGGMGPRVDARGCSAVASVAAAATRTSRNQAHRTPPRK